MYIPLSQMHNEGMLDPDGNTENLVPVDNVGNLAPMDKSGDLASTDKKDNMAPIGRTRLEFEKE